MKHKKYASLASLEIFKENSDSLYATQESVANKLDASEYIIDDSLSSTSTNPVQNKVIDAEFEAMSVAMNVLELSVDEKADVSHTHEITDVTNLSSTLSEISDAVAQKSQVQVITTDTSEILSTLKIHKLTQEEYDSLVENNALEDNSLYLTPDGEIDLSGYATKDDLNEKSDINHNHDESYYTKTDMDSALEGYAVVDHNHNSLYSNINHNHDDIYASSDHNHDSLYANINHNHDDVYYTETEIDAMLDGKSNADHNHDSDYDTKGAADDALALAKDYTDDIASDKSDVGHNHNISDVTNLQTTINEINDNVSQKSQVQIVKTDATEVLSTLKIHKLTKEEYEQELENGNLDDNVLYLTPDEETYYTETETDKLLDGKADADHNHDDAYDTKGAAADVQENLNSVVEDVLNPHIINTDIHVTTSDKSNWNRCHKSN